MLKQRFILIRFLLLNSSKVFFFGFSNDFVNFRKNFNFYTRCTDLTNAYCARVLMAGLKGTVVKRWMNADLNRATTTGPVWMESMGTPVCVRVDTQVGTPKQLQVHRKILLNFTKRDTVNYIYFMYFRLCM